MNLILHLGLGAFHRAHQAAYTQDAGGDWGIEAVSMRNPALARILTAQGGRYTLIERHPGGPRLIPITVIRTCHELPGHVRDVAARLADPRVHVVTLTVTEKGYGAVVPARDLDLASPDITADLAAPDADPQSLAGLLCLGLRMRRAAGGGGLTLMSCDNLPDNGRVLEGVVLGFARRIDPALADWIAGSCAFPCSMVDRITPAPGKDTYALIRSATGQEDRAAVETEPFRQWVIEDRFAGPRPDWETAGALIVPDVAPFEDMKLRLLNGSHSLMAYLGALADLPATRDVIAAPALRRLVRAHMQAAATTLRPLPGLDIAGYCDDLIARFENTAIDHRCLQIAMDGSQKLPQRLLAPVEMRRAQGADVTSFALTFAAWLRFAAGRSDGGAVLPLDDPLASELRALARDPDTAVARLADLPGFAGSPVLRDDAFAAQITALLRRLGHDGALGCVDAVLDTLGR